MTADNSTARLPSKLWRRLAYSAVACILLLLLLLGAASFVLSTQMGSEWALNRAVDRLNGGGGLSIEVENTEGTIFRGLSFGRILLVADSARVDIRDLRTSWNPYSLLTGKLLLSDLWISSLRVELQGSEADASSSDSMKLENPLPIGVSLSSLRIERLEILQDAEEYLARSISLGAELDNEGLSIASGEVTAFGVDIASDLTIGFADTPELTAQLNWRYDLAIDGRIEELAGRLELSGNLADLDITHQLESPQRILSRGSVVTGLAGGEFGFDLDHSADTLVLPMDIPFSYELRSIALATEGNLEALSLRLQSALSYEQFPSVDVAIEATYSDSVLAVGSYAVADADNSISGAANIDWSGVPNIAGNYVLRLPRIASFVDLPSSIQLANLAGAGDYAIDLPESGAEGRLTIEEFSGQLADYPLQGQGSLFFSQGGLEIDGLQLLTENNRLLLDGSYSDTVDLNWSLSAESLDEFLVDAAGALEGQGTLRGDPAAPDITGLLFGENLSFQAFAADTFEFEFQRIGGQLQSELTIDSFTYSDGSTTESLSPVVLLVSGTEASHRIDLNAISRFGDILLRLTGGVSDLQNIAWQGRLEEAALDTPLGSWATRSATDISLSAEETVFNESCWMQGSTALCFGFEHSTAAGLSASGSLQNYPLTVFNAGQLLNVDAGANLVQDQLLFLPQLPRGSRIAGQADGQFSLSLRPNEEAVIGFSLAASDALLQITPEQLASAEDFDEEAPPQEYNLEVLELSGEMQSSAWQLRANAGILRENLDDSEIDARGELSAAIDIAADGSLSGSVDAGLADLRWVQAIVPEFSAIEGSLNAQANLTGSLDAPQATGAINLRDASVTIDSLGITLNEITANVSSNNPQSIQLAGQANSDAGSIEFNGEILEPFGSMPTLSAQVRGADFQLANIPNLQLGVSPNVVVNADAASIEIIGSLDVPTLNLTLEQLPESAVDVSRDVVIVSYPGDRPDLARSIAASETTAFDIPLAGEINITLGDDVSFTGFGMNTKLAGNLNIQQTAGGSNRTYGELTIIEGSYEMYRQSLNISQGKLLFFGAYDNPGIDLRATREVDGYTVGVLMNGTLKNINSQLFSTPALADNDIIAVLVTGRPFSEMGQQDGDGDAVLTAIAKLGVGRSEGLTNQVRNKLGLDVLTVDPTNDINNSVLTIGKYITPDIFIRYGVGLFDSQSKVAVDYTLSERVKLQAESGEYQSVDIIYSVER